MYPEVIKLKCPATPSYCDVRRWLSIHVSALPIGFSSPLEIPDIFGNPATWKVGKTEKATWRKYTVQAGESFNNTCIINIHRDTRENTAAVEKKNRDILNR